MDTFLFRNITFLFMTLCSCVLLMMLIMESIAGALFVTELEKNQKYQKNTDIQEDSTDF